ncbi:MAG: head GIN domain-containing protein [Bacteroidota bacterium]
MKTITAQKNFLLQVILIITLAITLTLTATAAKQDRTVKNFSKIEISGAFDVTLSQGSAEKLTIEADDHLLPKIITEVKGGTLIIRIENNTHIRGDLNANLTFINLDGIDISGAVKINGTAPMKFSNLEIDGSGASKINLNLSASRVEGDFSGASEITLQGSATEFDIDLSGASDLDALKFETRNCNLDCSGASKAGIFATGTLTVDGSGATRVSYTGNPASVNSDMSGASEIRKI